MASKAGRITAAFQVPKIWNPCSLYYNDVL